MSVSLFISLLWKVFPYYCKYKNEFHLLNLKFELLLQKMHLSDRSFLINKIRKSNQILNPLATLLFQYHIYPGDGITLGRGGGLPGTVSITIYPRPPAPVIYTPLTMIHSFKLNVRICLVIKLQQSLRTIYKLYIAQAELD